MIFKFNRNTELEIIGIGIFAPGDFVVADDPVKARKYIDSDYFDLVKEKKVKKSKRKGVDKPCHKVKEDI